MKQDHHGLPLVRDTAHHLIEAINQLDLAEQRVILMAMLWAHEQGLSIASDQFISVPASVYAATFELDLQTAYEQLSQVSASLYKRNITLYDIHQPTGKLRKIQTRWVSAVGYIPDAALIQLQFSGMIVPYITTFEQQSTRELIAKIISV